MERRFHLKVGSAHLQLMKMAISSKGDVYVFPGPVPSGLHMSFHASGAKHVRDDHRFKEAWELPTSDEAAEALDAFRYEPDHGEKVFALPLRDDDPSALELDGKHMTLDAERAILNMPKAVEINVESIPRFLATCSQAKALVVDPVEGSMVLVDGSGQELLGLDMAHPEETLQRMRNSAFGRKVFGPIERGFQHAEKLATAGVVSPLKRPIFGEETEREFGTRLVEAMQSRFPQLDLD